MGCLCSNKTLLKITDYKIFKKYIGDVENWRGSKIYVAQYEEANY